MAESADAGDLKSLASNGVWVQVPPKLPINKKKLYYVPYCGVIYKLVAEFILGEI